MFACVEAGALTCLAERSSAIPVLSEVDGGRLGLRNWNMAGGRSNAALLFALGRILRKDGGVIIVTKKVAGLNEVALRRFTASAMAAARLGGEVNVLVTDDRELQRLNRRFRNKNTATDVLSFPAEATASKKLAGDIAISAEKASLKASRLGHSAMEEIKILILHGILHLAGYDHERDNGTMARKEAQLRRAFELPVALIERHGLDSPTRTKRLKRSRRT